MIPLSITESEYIALTDFVKEVTWLKGLVIEMMGDISVLTIHSDNQSALSY